MSPQKIKKMEKRKGKKKVIKIRFGLCVTGVSKWDCVVVK